MKRDKNFEPDLKCIDESETNATMAGGFTLQRQRSNTNFVATTYHTSQQLQQYSVKDFIPLTYDQ